MFSDVTPSSRRTIFKVYLIDQNITIVFTVSLLRKHVCRIEPCANAARVCCACDEAKENLSVSFDSRSPAFPRSEERMRGSSEGLTWPLCSTVA